ncbi:methionine ABC transporter ATP-binding protein [Cohnella lubricantis]|uniref:Methionine ABC transporter ATP-binding protein n=1 Tax=Cohnella lubricantis TaxID=2163172 RepID=A0A841TAI6_9BACL|nr:methionine ABC transporter ATP-binding protein [Cohnella lubricantis]MBB6677086.1 methionine ABC transporter ATP-binding protein [Cohnella lubricantis]MBP2118933.1 D-methionine transport system ATP-binding protein [Cohnella lubricantis]
MIQLKNVSKVFYQNKHKIEAVKNVTLEVQQGEIFGIIGFSGAGKSTLIRCINFLERPTEGTVSINGVDLASLKEGQLRKTRRKIGMIFQTFNLLSSNTVFDNVATPLRLAGAPRNEINRKVGELLEIVGLKEKEAMYPSQLSGGQKQRVAIARALASDPEILLCDEATSALDPQTTESILELLLEINRKYHITIVLITHEMHVIKKICDRVAVMENGKVVEQGKVLDVFSRPQQAITKNFIKTIFDVNLPESLLAQIKQHDDPGQLLRISFAGDHVAEPILAELAVKFALRPNIMYGNITQIKDTTFGTLVIRVTGEPAAIQAGIDYLSGLELQIEVIDYAG